jgi:hypothetical protein
MSGRQRYRNAVHPAKAEHAADRSDFERIRDSAPHHDADCSLPRAD